MNRTKAKSQKYFKNQCYLIKIFEKKNIFASFLKSAPLLISFRMNHLPIQIKQGKIFYSILKYYLTYKLVYFFLRKMGKIKSMFTIILTLYKYQAVP